MIFLVEIPNFLCGLILGSYSVTYHFWVTLTLDFVVISRTNRVQKENAILFEVVMPNLMGVWMNPCVVECHKHVPCLGQCDLHHE